MKRHSVWCLCPTSDCGLRLALSVWCTGHLRRHMASYFRTTRCLSAEVFSGLHVLSRRLGILPVASQPKLADTVFQSGEGRTCLPCIRFHGCSVLFSMWSCLLASDHANFWFWSSVMMALKLQQPLCSGNYISQNLRLPAHTCIFFVCLDGYFYNKWRDVMHWSALPRLLFSLEH